MVSAVGTEAAWQGAASGRRSRPGAVPRRVAAAGSRPAGKRPPILLLALAVLLFTVESRLHELVPAIAAIRPSMLAMIAGAIALLVTGEPWRSWRAGAFTRPILRTLAVYVVLAFLSVPFSIWVSGSMDAAINLLPAVCLMLVAAVTTARFGVRPILTLFMLALGLLSLAQIVKGFAVEPGRYTIGRSFDPNDMGTLLGALIPVGLALAAQRGAVLTRLLMALCAGLALYALARTGSRGGFVTLAVASLSTILLLRGPKKLVILGAAIMSMGLMVAVGPPAFRSRVTAMLSGEKDYNFTERGGRILVWQRGLVHMIRHPVTGVGIANFSTAEGEMLKEEGIRGAWMAPHNAFLQAGVELGIPGFITFLVLAGSLVTTAWRRARRRDAQPVNLALFGAILGYLAGSFFLSNAFAATIFLFAGLIAARPPTSGTDTAGVARPSRRPRRVAHAGIRGGAVSGGQPMARPVGW